MEELDQVQNQLEKMEMVEVEALDVQPDQVEMTETDVIEAEVVIPKQSYSKRIKLEVLIALYTARAFLPGLFQRQLFLIVFLILPIFDLSTDWINAGIVTQLSLTLFFCQRKSKNI